MTGHRHTPLIVGIGLALLVALLLACSPVFHIHVYLSGEEVAQAVGTNGQLPSLDDLIDDLAKRKGLTQ